MSRGRLIAFEGVDGAGKSTVIKRVAERLRESGQTVFMPRTGKEHSSRPTRMIRRLTRDRRNLAMDGRTEMLLYCAREAQVLSELVRPALARGETVLMDRSVLTAVVLGTARGVPTQECEDAARVATAGLQPDLTLVFEVQTRTSRLRKKIEKIRNHDRAEGGRKGMGGSGFKSRVRDAYIEIAASHGYPLFHVERATPDELSSRVLPVVFDGADAQGLQTDADRQPRWRGPADWTLQQGLAAQDTAAALFLSNGLICARELRRDALEQEPQLAAWGMDPQDPLRDAAAEVDPGYALRAWRRRPIDGPDDLRLQLMSRAPGPAIEALKHLVGDEVDAIRERHADSEPDAVMRSLTGRMDARAVALRDRCWSDADDASRAAAITHCTDEGARKRRRKLLEKNPVLGMSTMRGLADDETHAAMDAHAEQAAKPVLAALTGRDDDAAYAIRERLWDTGREVVDSIRGLDSDAAWQLRERAVEQHPSTVVHSMLGLEGPRVAPMRARCESLGAGDVHLLRRVQGLDERPSWPEWARERSADSDD